MRSASRRLLLLITACALIASVAGSANATTVSASPGGANTASAAGGSSVFFIHDGTFVLGCTAFSATSTWAGGSSSLPYTLANDVVLHMSGCSVAGIRFTFDCSRAPAESLVTGVTSGSRTPLLVNLIRCGIRLVTGCTANLDGGSGTGGAFTASYNNSTNGVLTIDAPTATNQTIAVSGSTCTSVYPNGPATISGASNGPLALSMAPNQTLTAI